jgi:hypothetical protein
LELIGYANALLDEGITFEHIQDAKTSIVLLHHDEIIEHIDRMKGEKDNGNEFRNEGSIGNVSSSGHSKGKTRKFKKGQSTK